MVERLDEKRRSVVGKDGGGEGGTVSVVSFALKTLKDAMVLLLCAGTVKNNINCQRRYGQSRPSNAKTPSFYSMDCKREIT